MEKAGFKPYPAPYALPPSTGQLTGGGRNTPKKL
jgi:hypothetical protein